MWGLVFKLSGHDMLKLCTVHALALTFRTGFLGYTIL